MKKGIALLLGLAMILSLAACGKSEKTSGGAASVFGDRMGNDKPSPEEIWVCVSEELKQNEDPDPSDVGVIIYYNYDYNEHGDRIRSETKTSPDFEPEVKETSYEYDNRGRVVRSTTSDGKYNTIEYQNNQDGTMTKTTTEWSSSYASEPSSVIICTYDADKQLLVHTWISYSDTHKNTTEETYTYDDAGNVLKFVRHLWDEYPDGEIKNNVWLLRTSTYDEHGNLLQQLEDASEEELVVLDENDSKVQILECENEYDEKGNLIHKTETYYLNGTAYGGTESIFEYDDAGNKVKSQYTENEGNSWHIQEYDQYGHVVLDYFYSDQFGETGIMKSTFMRLSDYLAGKTE